MRNFSRLIKIFIYYLHYYSCKNNRFVIKYIKLYSKREIQRYITVSAESKHIANIKYINIKMKKKLKNNSEIIYIIKDAGELCVKVLLFLLCCENPEKIDFEFIKNNIKTKTAKDGDIIKAMDFWKEKNILDYEITPNNGTKGVNMDNVINIILNVKRDINILSGEDSGDDLEFKKGLGIYDKYDEIPEPVDIVDIVDSVEIDETDEIAETIETTEIIEIAEPEPILEKPEETQPVNQTNQVTHVSLNSEPVSSDSLIESLETKDDFRRLIHEAQIKMQTSFNIADLGIMYNLHVTNNIEVDLILKLAETYAEDNKSNNIRYLEKAALGMAASGIFTMLDFEDKMRETHKIAEFEDKIKKLFKTENRKLTAKEKNYIKKWYKEFDFSDDMLSEGYRLCLKTIETLSFNYINGIYTNWNEKGFKTLDDVKNEHGPTPEVINNIVNKKNSGINVDQFFEKAVKRGMKF